MKIFLTIIVLSVSINIHAQNKGSNLTVEQKDSILDAHNMYRTEVNVDSIKWDEQLANGAQEWAKKLAKKNCILKHNTSINLGENIYWTGDPGLTYDCVYSWGEEKKYYKGGKNINANNGHYTQMVWWSTNHVGCAFAKCKKGAEIWVCRYSPPGNMMGEKAFPKHR